MLISALSTVQLAYVAITTGRVQTAKNILTSARPTHLEAHLLPVIKHRRMRPQQWIVQAL